jgi:spore coat polysaccharide biosynthesis protein SpsF
MKFSVIVAARMGSSRLPGKALLPLAGLPMISLLFHRIRGSKLASDIVLATTDRPEDDRLAERVRADGVPVFRGAAEDVVQRYVDVARQLDAEYVVRVTGDCPFIDAAMVDHCLQQCIAFDEFDLSSTKTLFPAGIDCEVYRAESLRRLHESPSLSASDREHVTRFFYEHEENFSIRRIEPAVEWRSNVRPFTVDSPEDYEYAKRLAGSFATPDFSISDLIIAAEALA